MSKITNFGEQNAIAGEQNAIIFNQKVKFSSKKGKYSENGTVIFSVKKLIFKQQKNNFLSHRDHKYDFKYMNDI